MVYIFPLGFAKHKTQVLYIAVSDSNVRTYVRTSVRKYDRIRRFLGVCLDAWAGGDLGDQEPSALSRTLSRALNMTVPTVIARQVEPIRTTVEQPQGPVCKPGIKTVTQRFRVARTGAGHNHHLARAESQPKAGLATSGPSGRQICDSFPLARNWRATVKLWAKTNTITKGNLSGSTFFFFFK